MSRRTYGILAGLIGSAVGAWWYSRRRPSTPALTPGREHGTVIFDNTPTATPASTEGVI